jgi:hypothetical protein
LFKQKLPNNDRLEVIAVTEKKRLLETAMSLIRVRVNLPDTKALVFLPVSETLRNAAPSIQPTAILMDSGMFSVLKNFLKGTTVLVVPSGKETVSIDEVEVYNL